MPIRDIRISTWGPTGYFYSKKNGRMIAYESLVERDYYLTLEFDDSVLKYEEQPLSVTKMVDGRERTFFPDCLVTFHPNIKRQPLLVEVKSAEELEDKDRAEDLKIKFAALEEYVKNNEMEFRIVLDKNIRGQYLENLKFLYRYVDEPATFGFYRDRIMEALRANESVTVTELLQILSGEKMERARILPSVWHLVSTKAVTIDLNKPLTNGSLIEVNP